MQCVSLTHKIGSLIYKIRKFGRKKEQVLKMIRSLKDKIWKLKKIERGSLIAKMRKFRGRKDRVLKIKKKLTKFGNLKDKMGEA